jgi:hypothetical protein
MTVDSPKEKEKEGEVGRGEEFAACEILPAGTPCDEGFTVAGLSCGAEAYEQCVPVERRIAVRVRGGGQTYGLDLLDVYTWLRANPAAGLPGPFGTCPLTARQREALVSLAEERLPVEAHLSQMGRFDHAWHDDGSDLHYHDPASLAYLIEAVAERDLEKLLYVLEEIPVGLFRDRHDVINVLSSALASEEPAVFSALVRSQQARQAMGIMALAHFAHFCVRRAPPSMAVDSVNAVAEAADELDDSLTEREWTQLSGEVQRIYAECTMRDDGAETLIVDAAWACLGIEPEWPAVSRAVRRPGLFGHMLSRAASMDHEDISRAIAWLVRKRRLDCLRVFLRVKRDSLSPQLLGGLIDAIKQRWGDGADQMVLTVLEVQRRWAQREAAKTAAAAAAAEQESCPPSQRRAVAVGTSTGFIEGDDSDDEEDDDSDTDSSDGDEGEEEEEDDDDDGSDMSVEVD